MKYECPKCDVSITFSKCDTPSEKGYKCDHCGHWISHTVTQMIDRLYSKALVGSFVIIREKYQTYVVYVQEVFSDRLYCTYCRITQPEEFGKKRVGSFPFQHMKCIQIV